MKTISNESILAKHDLEMRLIALEAKSKRVFAAFIGSIILAVCAAVMMSCSI
jgi:hypothetical protein